MRGGTETLVRRGLCVLFSVHRAGCAGSWDTQQSWYMHPKKFLHEQFGGREWKNPAPDFSQSGY